MVTLMLTESTQAAYLRQKGCAYFVEFAAIAYDFDDDNFHVIKLKNPEEYFHDLERIRTILFFPENQLEAKREMYDILYSLSVEEANGNKTLIPVTNYIEKNERLKLCNFVYFSSLTNELEQVFFRHA